MAFGMSFARPAFCEARRVMRIIERAEETVWRVIEWSFVMGMLSWLFVRLWTETIYDPHRARALRRRPSLWSRLPFGDARRRRSSVGEDRNGAGDSA